MFKPNIYLILLFIGVTLFFSGFYTGCSYQQSKAEKVIRDKEHEYQAKSDEIRKVKDEKINSINTQLVDAISELRKRPSRATEANNGQVASGCNGSQLYAEDAELLVRESARAEKIRISLLSCYEQYDSIK